MKLTPPTTTQIGSFRIRLSNVLTAWQFNRLSEILSDNDEQSPDAYRCTKNRATLVLKDPTRMNERELYNLSIATGTAPATWIENYGCGFDCLTLAAIARVNADFDAAAKSQHV